MSNTLLRLLKYCRPHLRLICIGLGFLFSSSLAEVSGPLLIKYFIDTSLATGHWIAREIGLFIITYLSLQGLAAFSSYKQALLFSRVAQYIVKGLRQEAFSAALRLPARYLDNHQTGHLISTISNDTETLLQLYIQVIGQSIHKVVKVVSSPVISHSAADVAQLLARHEVLLDLLERDVLRLRNEGHRQDDEEAVEEGVEPEGMCRAERIDEREERRTDDSAGDPVRHRRAGNAELTALERLDLRAEDPDDRAGAHAEARDADHRHDRSEVRDPSRCRAAFQHGHADADSSHRERHDAEANLQGRLAAGFIDHADGNERGQREDNTIEDRADHLVFRAGKTSQAQNFG